MTEIPFNRAFLTGQELDYIRDAYLAGQLSGDGKFTKLCQGWLERGIGSKKALLTHSCTGALEMAAFLAEIGPGDEVILPSYTFVSTANAFVLRGAVPVFVDIRPDTLNLDERKIEAALTKRTKAIVPVHYAGVACEMDEILAIAKERNVSVIEDAAQGVRASYRGRPLGGIGQIGALSFHETKNIVSGEGGALLVNDESHVDRAHVLWQKGTNRQKFLRGMVDKYTWVDVGSSFLPSELTAAFLWAQMNEAETITKIRLGLWQSYYEAFAELEKAGMARRPVVPAHVGHNAHMFYLLVDPDARDGILKFFKSRQIGVHFHYVPLHSSPAGRKYGRVSGKLEVTDRAAASVIRLPLWAGLTAPDQRRVIDGVHECLKPQKARKSSGAG